MKFYAFNSFSSDLNKTKIAVKAIDSRVTPVSISCKQVIEHHLDEHGKACCLV